MKTNSRHISRLLDGMARTLGVNVCFHDNPGLAGLDRRYRIHNSPCCREVKTRFEHECVKHDVRKLQRLLICHEAGMLVECPAGFTEIVCPVYVNSLMGGVLFAGQFWTKKGKAPYEGLIYCRDEERLEDLRAMVASCARRLGRLLELRGQEEDNGDWQENDRRHLISDFMARKFALNVKLADLAEHLHLSESRTAHALNEIFGLGFSQLLRRFRMQEAMRMLSTTRLPITEVAFTCGFEDSNYFSRIFRKEITLTPKQYRERFHHEP